MCIAESELSQKLKNASDVKNTGTRVEIARPLNAITYSGSVGKKDIVTKNA